MEKTNAKTKTYNVIIMDRSGSMWDIQKSAIKGFNEVFRGVKSAAKKYSKVQEQLITLVLFDSDSIDNVYWNADPFAVPTLNKNTYVPGACTPLYDAIGQTLTRLEKELKEDEDHSVVVTIITDGLENCSTEYSGMAVKALVEHLKTKGWSFAYMGTDHDVYGAAVHLSISNVIQFQKTEAETLKTFRKERLAREKWAETEAFYCLDEPAMLPEEKVKARINRSKHYYE